ASAGSTSGFSYSVTSWANTFAYDTNVTGNVAPTAKQNPAGMSSGVALLLSASIGSSTLPVVTGVSPSSGPAPGGTSVTISGSNFTGASTVKFGTVTGTGLVVNSATSITVTAPAESSGTIDVTVTTPQGTSVVNAPADRFTFVVAVQITSRANTRHTQSGSTVTFDFTFSTT